MEAAMVKKTGATHSQSESRRKEIILAALACFTEQGINETSITDIRRRSKASVGSIYHHFGNKEQLARTVYLEGIRDYQAGLADVLERYQDAREGVFAIVRYHLEWAKQNPEWTRFLFQKRHADFMSSTEKEFKEMNVDFARRIASWFQKHVRAGALKLLPPDLYPCILLGPCQEFLHHYLATHTVTSLDTAAREFGKAAWQALSGGGEKEAR